MNSIKASSAGGVIHETDYFSSENSLEAMGGRVQLADELNREER